jgi:L-threonylcarbamoyladenylate synthase
VSRYESVKAGRKYAELNMRTIIFNINKNEKLLKQSAKAVKRGATAVFATDTVYGIGTNAFNKKSVLKIYKLKKRPLSKLLPLLVSSVYMAKKYVYWNDKAQKFEKKFVPGALTLVLKAKGQGKKIAVPPLSLRRSPPITTFGDRLWRLRQSHKYLKTLAVRIPKHKNLQKWIKIIGLPVASTSANISKKPALKNEKQVIKQFNGKVDYILTGGNLKGKESAVVDLTGNKPVTLRGKLKNPLCHPPA